MPIMHIYYLSLNNIPSRGTHSINIMNMCRAFSRIPGVEVTLLIHANRAIRDQFQLDVWNFYGMDSSFAIHYFSPPGPIARRIPLLGKATTLLKVFFVMLKAFRSEDGDFLIYSRHARLAGLAQFVFRITGNRQFRGYFAELHALISARHSLRRCRGLIAIAQSLKDDLLNSRVIRDGGRVHVAHDGVNMGRFSGDPDVMSIRRKLGVPENKKVIAYTGRLIAGKGVDVLISAFAKLPNQDGLFLLLVGKIYESKYRQMVEEKGLDNVAFIDFIPPVQVSAYQSCADILVLPTSRELPYARYTSPIKLFEYMAAEKPIVATSLPGVCEIVTHGRNGLLVRPDDAVELAGALSSLLEDEALGKRMAQQARADAAGYTWDNRALGIYSFMETMGR